MCGSWCTGLNLTRSVSRSGGLVRGWMGPRRIWTFIPVFPLLRRPDLDRSYTRPRTPVPLTTGLDYPLNRNGGPPLSGSDGHVVVRSESQSPGTETARQ